MNRELIEKLVDALQHAVDCLSLEGIILAREPTFLKKWEALIAEAHAALAAPVVTPDEWLTKTAQLVDDLEYASMDVGHELSDVADRRNLINKRKELFAHLRVRPAVPEGYKLLKDTTFEDRSWPDDFIGENGSYYNGCHRCLRQFLGHKRRVTCRSCAAPKEHKHVD